jgi:hypothetical protein
MVAVRKNLDLVWDWFYKEVAPTALNMKTIKFILLCLSLTTAIASAKDFHLVETQVSNTNSQGHLVYSWVYVLIAPDGTKQSTFTTFEPKTMGQTIVKIVRKGILYYDASPIHNGGDILPTNAQIQSLQDYCKTNGIDLILTPTN